LKIFIEAEFITKAEELLESVIFSTTMLNNLINDLLDLAKMESLTFKFNEEYFDLHKLVKSSFQQMKFMAK
jgi:signal transduction histidine kinase